MSGDGGDDPEHVPSPAGFDLAGLASFARPREVTGATFSYVDAMLTGRMSEEDLKRIREDLLGETASPSRDPALESMEALYRTREYAAALAAAEEILAGTPGQPSATRIAEACRHRLADLYQSHLGTGIDVPRLAVPIASLGSCGLDRWAAYLLSRLDGIVSIDELVQLSGFSRLDTLRLLYELVQRGIVAIERRAPPTSGPSAPRDGGAVLARVKLKRTTG